MIAEKLRELAAATADQVAAKRDPAIGRMNRTARRARIAASIREDADRLERVQHVLEALADGHAGGYVPPVLARITTRAHVDSLLSYPLRGEPCGEHAERLARVGIAGRVLCMEARQWAEAFTRPKTPAQSSRERIRFLEDGLIGVDIPGFFPTPPSIIRRMIEAADLRPDHRTLEPSAGKGDILDAIAEAGVGQTVRFGCEIVPRLREICCLKGHLCTCRNFLEVTRGWLCNGQEFETFDRIIMNPPFERLQDIEHVRHAFDLLAPGGRLVAITSLSAWTRDTRTADSFRRWVDDLGGADEALPEDAFNTREAFRRTGVRCKLLILDK